MFHYGAVLLDRVYTRPKISLLSPPEPRHRLRFMESCPQTPNHNISVGLFFQRLSIKDFSEF